MIISKKAILNDFIKEVVRLQISYDNNPHIFKSKYEQDLEIIKNLSYDVDLNTFIYLLNRHSLISYFAKSNVLDYVNPKFSSVGKSLFKKELIHSFKIFQLTNEINQILKTENIKFLIIKGAPLSLQVFGNLGGRGKSIDVDILIDFKQLIRIIDILSLKGFKVKRSQIPYLSKSIFGKYCRFIAPELTLYRINNNFLDIVDLHWRLSWISDGIPSFDEAYLNRVYLNIDGISMPTLNHLDTVKHVCNHAAVENWESIRNLIDIDILIKKTPINQIPSLKRNKLIRWSTAVTYKITESDYLQEYFRGEKNSNILYCLKQANGQQLLEKKTWGKNGWTIISRLNYLIRFLKLSESNLEFFRMILKNFFPPNGFIEPQTNTVLNIVPVIFLRFKKLIYYILISIKKQ